MKIDKNKFIHFPQLKIEDMKIILDGSQPQEAQEPQQFVIIQSQSLAGKSKMETDDVPDGQDEIVYVLKDENTSEQSSVIQLDSNCVNQEQFVWIANEQGGDSSSQMQAASTVYTIKELNYAQVNFMNKFSRCFIFNISLFSQDITNSTQSASSDASNDSSSEKMTIEEGDAGD